MTDPNNTGTYSSPLPGTLQWWASPHAYFAIMALLGLADVFVHCLVLPPRIMSSFCGTCSHEMFSELQGHMVGGGFLCFGAWLIAPDTVSKRIARAAGLACLAMWIAVWGFFRGWW
jgi:hypothetical protein